MKKLIILLVMITSFPALAQTKYIVGNQNCEVQVKIFPTQVDDDTAEEIFKLFKAKGYQPTDWPVTGNNYSILVSISSSDTEGSYFGFRHATTSLWSSRDSKYVAEEDITIGLLGGNGNKAYRTAKRFVENKLLPCKK